MLVLKSILAGLVALVIALCLLAGVIVGAVITAQWGSAYGEGSGGIGAVIGVSEVWASVGMLAALLIFAAGFRWRFERG